MPRILLVDDDESFRKMLRINLVKLGHEVREARDGKAAVRLFEEAPSDVVMTDLIMPDQEGMETIVILKHRRPGVQIIAMSGGGRCSAIDYLKTASAMGADRVLAKPFSNDEMRMVLDELLGQNPVQDRR